MWRRRWKWILGSVVLAGAVLFVSYAYQWYRLVYTFSVPLAKLNSCLVRSHDGRLFVGTVGGLDDDGLDQLVELMATRPEIRDLRIEETQVTDEGLRHLAELPYLTHLDLSYTRLSDAALVHVGKLKNLQSLSLEGCGSITGSGLIHLTALNDLRQLRLRGSGLSGCYLREIGRLRALRSLDLGVAELRDEDLKHLQSLASLEELWLDGCGVSDAGIVHLRVLIRLRTLELASDDGVTDTSVATLAQLKELRDLGLPATVSAAATERLRNHLPKCRIRNYSQ
jgi:internalin A